MSVSLISPGASQHCVRTAYRVLVDLGRLVVLTVKPCSAVAVEKPFLRKKLAMFQERKVKPRRADHGTRWLMAALSGLFNWCGALVVVNPDTLIRWHRKGLRLFWSWKVRHSQAGRPTVSGEVRDLIRRTSQENPFWGAPRGLLFTA